MEENSREATYAALRELLLQGPWADITVKAVAKRVGVSRQTIYNNFGSRHGLLRSYVFALADAYCDLAAQRLADATSIRGGLEAALRDFLELGGVDPLFARVQAGQGHPDLVAMLTSQSAPLVMRVAARIEQALLQRWPDTSPRAARAGGIATARLVVGLATMPPSDEEGDLAAVLADLLTHGLNQVRPEPEAPFNR